MERPQYSDVAAQEAEKNVTLLIKIHATSISIASTALHMEKYAQVIFCNDVQLTPPLTFFKGPAEFVVGAK